MGAGAKIAQTLLVAFNFVFVLIGLAGIIVGALIRVKYTDYEALSTKDIGAVSILLIILGGIIFIVAFFGCCGAMKKSVVMLTIYIIFLVILLVIEVAGGITAYVYKDNLKDYIRGGMENAMDNYNTSKYKEALDKVQKEGCVDSLFDYLKDHMAAVGGLAIGVAVVQIIGIIFACVVRRDVKEGYNYV